MRIPRVFHQIWLGPDPLPEAHARYQRTWLDHHPGWELRLWSEENLPFPLRRPEAAERLRSPAERANILRLELLWRFGGVYVDTDFECLRSLEPLIDEAEIFISLAKPGKVNNALMGSVAGHPLLERALVELRPREFFGHDKAGTGTRFLDGVLLGQPGVALIAPELVYPQTESEQAGAYAVHRMSRSWKGEELLRLDLERAERRLRRARESEQKWRRRYQEARAELERLERLWPARLARKVHLLRARRSER